MDETLDAYDPRTEGVEPTKLTEPAFRPRLTEGERKLLELATWLLDYWYEFDCSDIDGGDFQNYLDDHILEEVKVDKPCIPDGCKCDEFNDGDFPLMCSRYQDGILETLDNYRRAPK